MEIKTRELNEYPHVLNVGERGLIDFFNKPTMVSATNPSCSLGRILFYNGIWNTKKSPNENSDLN